MKKYNNISNKNKLYYFIYILSLILAISIIVFLADLFLFVNWAEKCPYEFKFNINGNGINELKDIRGNIDANIKGEIYCRDIELLLLQNDNSH